MSTLGAALVKLSSRLPNRRGEPTETGIGDAVLVPAQPVPAAPTDEVSKSAMLDELQAMNAITAGQFKKLAEEMSREDAEASLRRLQKLEEATPSGGKLLRGTLVGASMGPMANLAWRAAAGSKARMGQPIYLGLRPQLAIASHGAIFGGLMPFGQNKLETQVEKQHLRKYLDTHPRGALPGEIKKVTGD